MLKLFTFIVAFKGLIFQLPKVIFSMGFLLSIGKIQLCTWSGNHNTSITFNLFKILWKG